MATFIATVHLMVEADSEAGACDCISESLRSMPDSFPDWGYATLREPIPSAINGTGTTTHAGPVEIEFPEGHDYEEGDFYDFVPASHRLIPPQPDTIDSRHNLDGVEAVDLRMCPKCGGWPLDDHRCVEPIGSKGEAR